MWYIISPIAQSLQARCTHETDQKVKGDLNTESKNYQKSKMNFDLLYWNYHLVFIALLLMIIIIITMHFISLGPKCAPVLKMAYLPNIQLIFQTQRLSPHG